MAFFAKFSPLQNLKVAKKEFLDFGEAKIGALRAF
jgi:hypothetical protein